MTGTINGLTRDTLAGIWVGLPTPWDERERLDLQAFEAAVETVGRWDIAGIYTTGGTGEFWAIDESEFPELMKALENARARLHRRVPTMAGVSAQNLRSVLRRSEIALASGADALQVALPTAYPLTGTGVDIFYSEIRKAFPGVPILAWNYRHQGGGLLGGSTFKRLAADVPELIGLKVDLPDYGLWWELRTQAPELACLVGEPVLATLARHGARGSCSSMTYVAPKVILELYEACRSADWPNADRLGARIDSFFRDAVAPLMVAGFPDPAIDKGMAAAAGWIPCSRRVRAPFESVSDQQVLAMRKMIEERYPEFLEAPVHMAPPPVAVGRAP